MGTLGKRALFETLRSFDSSTFSGSYQKLGTQITNPSVLLKLVNNSLVTVTLSYDGVNDHDVILAGTGVIYDFGSDAQTAGHGDKRLALSALTQVWIKGTASTGLVYLVTVYTGD
jgi:hypothetical protein